MDKINQKRLEIDELDNKIMSLLDKRFELTTEIGSIKKVEKKVVLDINREENILNKTSKYSHSPQIRSIYNTIMDESKSLQRK